MEMQAQLGDSEVRVEVYRTYQELVAELRSRKFQVPKGLPEDTCYLYMLVREDPSDDTAAAPCFYWIVALAQKPVVFHTYEDDWEFDDEDSPIRMEWR